MFNGLVDQHLGHSILGKQSDLVFSAFMDFSGLPAAEVIAMPLAPLLVTLSECGEAQAPHTVQMPKGRGKVHPLLAAVLTGGAGEKGVDTGKGLIQQGNQVVLHGDLGLRVQAILPVHGFQLVTNCIHRSMLTQFYPVVKTVPGDVYKRQV